MPIWNVEIKHDTRHRKWHRLSVRALAPMPTIEVALYAIDWAIDNQANPDQVSYRQVCDETGEQIVYPSNVTANRPT